MRRIRLLLSLHRPVAHVLHAQRGGNHQRLVQRLARTGFEQHAPHPGVQRQAAQFLTQRRQLIGIVHGTQFIEQLVTIGNCAAAGALQKREVLHNAQMQRLHAQNHAS